MAGNEILVTPPIRQSVEDVQSAQANGLAQPLTNKTWYLFWDQLGKMANRQAGMISYGTHANRPDPSVTPDGALYVETDRGVIYQNINGQWTYLAGTMWGTLSPDQRPTDLGANDTGFTFRGTDYPRSFVWNGTAWVESTLVRWGSHAGRLALVLTTVIDGELYVESDRFDVMYQNQGGAWRYIGGTMYGTVTPTDQRPTDLGSQDAGFDFRTNTAPAHEFVWSGTGWIEVGADYRVNGALIGTRPSLNLIAGSNVTLSGSDNAGSDRVDVTITSSGGGGTGGAVSSVFTRTGAVVAQTGDYTAAQVTNAVDQTQSYSNPAWITTLPYSKLTGVPAMVNTFNTRVGAVVPQSGDYTAAQVTNAVDASTTYSNPAWITGLAWSKITGAPAFLTALTPWTSNINAATFSLNSLGTLAVGLTAVTSPALVHIRKGNSAVTPTGQLFVENSGAAAYIETACTNLTDSCGYLFSSAGSLTSYIIDLSSNLSITATGASRIMTFATNTTERMRITAAGIVGIGTTSPASIAKLHVAGGALCVGASAGGGVAGDVCVSRESAATTGAIFFGNAGHYIYHDGTTFNFNPATSNLPSDARLKQNVRDLTGGIDVINQIRPIEAEWNGLGDTPKGKRIVSVLAQELQKVLPGAVGKYQTPGGEEFMNYNPDEILLQAVLAIQELSRRLERLESRK